MKKVVVLVPLYREEISPEERTSLCQCAKIFGGQREVVFFAPGKLNAAPFLQLLPEARVERFDDCFFASVSTYSRLLLTPEFYLRFQEYEYILIYQLDAWVFRDELDYWCSKGYDYMGAPFIHKGGRAEMLVLNGGFSLRRIEAMLRVLNNPDAEMFPPSLLKDFFTTYISSGHYIRALVPLFKLMGLLPNTRGKYLEYIQHEKFNSEDMVYHYLSRQFTADGLIIPDAEEAALFALEADPVEFFRKIPFGCHAWPKSGAEFWKKHIPFLSEYDQK